MWQEYKCVILFYKRGKILFFNLLMAKLSLKLGSFSLSNLGEVANQLLVSIYWSLSLLWHFVGFWHFYSADGDRGFSDLFQGSADLFL